MGFKTHFLVCLEIQGMFQSEFVYLVDSYSHAESSDFFAFEISFDKDSLLCFSDYRFFISSISINFLQKIYSLAV